MARSLAEAQAAADELSKVYLAHFFVKMCKGELIISHNIKTRIYIIPAIYKGFEVHSDVLVEYWKNET